MKLSAAKVARKCTLGLAGCDPSAIGVVLTLGLLASPAQARLTTPHIPLPMARPADAPARAPAAKPTETKPSDTDAPADVEQPAAAQKPAEPAPPSPCRVALTESIAIAPSIADIKGPGACGGTDIVRLDAIVLPDNSRVPLKPSATMRCTMATAVADWIRTDMAPLAGSLGTRLSELDNFDSFDCRGRNRVVGAKMSEHGRANALDVRGLKLANGQSIALTERSTPRELRDKVLQSVCARFTTVLGPGSDGYHEDHVHLDLAERRNNYRICQWEVWDPMPVVAPLLPADRPAEAPPRDVADAGDGKGAAAKPVESQPVVSKPAEAAPVAESAPEHEPEAVAPTPVKPKAKSKPKQRRRAAMPSPFSIFR
ncbi:MAG: extensin family protein [Tardiphaga sp.]